MNKIQSPITKAILLIIFALSINLLAQPSSAQQFTDFFISAHETVSAFQCTTVTDYVLITNTMGETQQYALELDRPGAVWTIVFPETFTLLPGQTQEVVEQITLPCSAKEPKQLLLYVTTSTQQETIEQEIVPQTPLNIDLTVKPIEQTIKPCASARYEIYLKNLGDFEETYTLSTTAAEAVFSNTTFVLQTNSSAEVALWIKPKDCSNSETQNFLVRAQTKNTNLAAEQQLKLSITRTGIADIASGTRTISTTYRESNANLSLVNTGSESITYSLSITGANWAVIEPTALTIPANSVRSFSLHFAPTPKTREGYWPIIINARAESTGNTYSKQIYLFLERDSVVVKYISNHWFGLALMITVFFVFVEATRRVAGYTNSPAYLAAKLAAKKQKTIKKEQRKKQELKQIQQKQKLLLKKQEREQEQEEKKRQGMLRQAELSLQEKYDFVPKQEAKPDLMGKTIAIILLIIVLIIGAGSAYLYRALLAKNLLFLFFGVCLSVAIIIIFILIRAAVLSRRHIVSQAHLIKNHHMLIKGWKKGILNCAIQNTDPVSQPSIKLSKGCSESIPPDQLTYKTYQLRTTFAEQIKKVEISFAVPKKWMIKNHVNLRKIHFQCFTNNTWKTIPVLLISQNNSSCYYSCQTSATGSYAITAVADEVIVKELHVPKKIKKDNVKKKPSRIAKRSMAGIVILLVLLSTALTTYILSAPAPFQQSPAGIPSQSWYANTQHSINLAHYFKDPDNDLLKYTTKVGPHIFVEVKNNLAVLTPEKNWTGQSYIIFAVDDGKEGMVVSNAVKLIVRKPVIPQVVWDYAKPALLGVLILLIAVCCIKYTTQIKNFLMKD